MTPLIIRFLLLASVAIVLTACSSTPRPGAEAFERRGDEIVVAGRYFHTGTPIVLWTDPGGYDAYRVERRFVPWEEASWEVSKEKLDSPNRYNQRFRGNWPPEVLEQIRGGGWDLELLQDTVDLFVMHYDVTGSARRTFNILHDHRGLSVHFMLDVDGTIYQTLDLKERAWHAGPANSRSVGIEIANIGAYGEGEDNPLDRWYTRLPGGDTIMTYPQGYGETGVRTPRFIARPMRDEPVTGSINGRELEQYDFTPQQYLALEKLTATLAEIFPKLKIDVPRNADGTMLTDRPLTDEELEHYSGLVGHHHISQGKVDPGPAFQWDRVMDGAKHYMD